VVDKLNEEWDEMNSAASLLERYVGELDHKGRPIVKPRYGRGDTSRRAVDGDSFSVEKDGATTSVCPKCKQTVRSKTTGWHLTQKVHKRGLIADRSGLSPFKTKKAAMAAGMEFLKTGEVQKEIPRKEKK
jgi:hypothetical protein